MTPANHKNFTNQEALLMSSIGFSHDMQLSRLRAKEAIESRLLFTALFPIFLTAGVLRRVLPHQKDSARRSVFAEARAAANTCIPFAFMR